MPVIAVVNRKGGSGKSTLATHLAAYCANAGMSVMLGDVDRQQSTQTWLRLRAAHNAAARPPILGWVVEPKRGLHAPPGTTHVILDTPGGLTGFDLARVVMYADAILMPVCNSVFDRASAAQCHAELLTLPRVASGRCRVAAVGMRLDARTRAAEILETWAEGLKLPFIGALRETQAYVRCIENGMTLFDLPAAQVEVDLLQWDPLLRWLAPVLRPATEEAAPTRATLTGGQRSILPPASLSALRPAARPPHQAVSLHRAPAMAAQAPGASAGLAAAALAPPPMPARASAASGGVAVPERAAAGGRAELTTERPPQLDAIAQPANQDPPPRAPPPPVRGALADQPPLAWGLRSLFDLRPMFKRVQRRT